MHRLRGAAHAPDLDVREIGGFNTWPGGPGLREESNMTRIHKLFGAAFVALLLVATATAPAKAQFAGSGDQDMMTQMAPMLDMMKAKLGKKRFGALMQTMGPMMSKMMDGSGSTNFGGFSGMNFGGFGGSAMPFVGDASGFNAGDMMSMIPQLMSLANMGGGGHHRRHAHHKS